MAWIISLTTDERMKVPNSKFQVPRKFRTPSRKESNRHFGIWSLVIFWNLVIGIWSFSSSAQPLSNLVFTVGTTIQDALLQNWSYVLLGAPAPQLLAGKQFAVFSKAGFPTNSGTFALRGTIFQQTDVSAINTLLNQIGRAHV